MRLEISEYHAWVYSTLFSTLFVLGVYAWRPFCGFKRRRNPHENEETNKKYYFE